MASHEYSLHFLVNELVRTLSYVKGNQSKYVELNFFAFSSSFSVPSKGTSLAPELIVDYFNKNTNSQANTYTPVNWLDKSLFSFSIWIFLFSQAELVDAKRKLIASSSSLNEFADLYDSLKARQ